MAYLTSFILAINIVILHAAVAVVLFTALVLTHYLLDRRLKRKYSKKGYQNIIKEKQLLEQLFNNMPDRIYFKDRESRFIIANKHVSKVMGENNPEKLVGKTDFDFYEEHYARAYFDDEQRIMKEGKPMITKEEKGLDLEGNEIFVSTTKIPIFGKQKEVIGIIGIGRDITPQKTAEEQLSLKTKSLKEANFQLKEKQNDIQQMAEELNAQAEHLRKVNSRLEYLSLVASKTENVVVIMDGNGNFEWVNQGFEEKYGKNMKDFTDEYGSNLRDSSSNENISAVLNQIYITRRPYTYSSRFIDHTGKEAWNQTNISPILDANNEISKLILIDSDITELKYAEEHIKKQNKEIQAKSAELQKLNATKDRLFSIIAHDLKNPFHSILGFTNLLEKKYKDIEREKLRELLGMISESTSSAYNLLENLLDWARTQTDRIKYNPVNLNIRQIAGECVSVKSLQANNKDVSLNNEIPEDIYVYADQNMITTVFRNIAGNAIKYSNQGGEVRFSAAIKGKKVIVKISDKGVGMTEDNISQLFQLDRVNSTSGTSGEQGTGLGLIICHEFLKRNEGTINVESTPGKGSTFIITLPAVVIN